MILALVLLLGLASCDNDKSIRVEDNILIIEEGVEQLARTSYNASIQDVTDVYLPKSLKRLDNEAFFNLGAEVRNIYYAGDLASWNNISFGSNYANPMGHGWLNEKLSFYYMKDGDYTRADDLILPEGITAINEYAFNGFRTNRLVIPKSTVEIKKYAFLGASFNEIVMPTDGRLKRIERSAFEHITYTGKELTIPNTVEYIGREAFAISGKVDILRLPYIPNLSIDMPFLTFIGAYQFKNVYITKGIEIGLLAGPAFNGNLIFCDSVERLLPNAIHGAFVETIYFSPNSRLTEICDEAMAGLPLVFYIFLPAGLSKVHEDAFRGSFIANRPMSHAKAEEELLVDKVKISEGLYSQFLINDFEKGWMIKNNKLYVYGSAQD